MAGTTGLEPATSAVTGQRSNQLSYVPFFERAVLLSPARLASVKLDPNRGAGAEQTAGPVLAAAQAM